MIVNFSVKNYKSIKEEIVLIMQTAAMKEIYDLPSQAFISVGPSLDLTLSAVIYGANASGKSNLLDALMYMKFHIQTSMAMGAGAKVPVEPFRLSTVTENEPTEFEISFVAKNKLFRYGFSATRDKVIEEWLYEKELKPKAKEKELFYRENETLKYHPSLYKIGKLISDQKLAKDTVLILTLGYQLNDELSKDIMDWFVTVSCLHGHREEGYSYFSAEQTTKQTALSGAIADFMKYADTGITTLSSAIVLDKQEILSHHTQFDQNGKEAGEKTFIMSEQESAGTKKFYHLIGPILHTLKEGLILTIDELDAQLHPNLLALLVRMFQDRNINRKGAQLIFTAHNTNLLNEKLFRRDQVWLTDKDRFGVTSLYAITDFKTDKGNKARNKEAIGQNYINGKYGGVPFLGDFENFLDNYADELQG